ncbi:MAG: ABC transporter ATP-binding protein [Anaerolineales bacterium]|jgi:NitT/TauT family transport system ATP-binding protein|nr:ABC transporter ATP-binding protein [Anaerolineales bacterium]|tara:strand:+ start:46111 stop:46893 length:783 start_codon:yes stop_codon:yes gene_type:complete
MNNDNDSRPVIEIQDVSKHFGSSSGAVHALQGVSLTVEPGEFISLIGPSGCGKSTLLRTLGDLIQPTSGTVNIKQKSASQARADRDYGIIFQSPILFEWRNIRQNIELPLKIMGFPKSEWAERVDSQLDLVGLREFENHYPWQLSGGMQQRVAIARALAFEPSILLMDEPFGALDEMTREYLNLELLNIFTRTDVTIIFVTHSIPEAVFLSRRVVVMSARPGTIKEIVSIDLPYPRSIDTRETPRYFELVTMVRESLRTQ